MSTIPKDPRRGVHALSLGDVTLAPLTASDVDAIWAACASDRSTYGYTPVPTSREATENHITSLLRDESVGDTINFVVRHQERVVGMTRYLTLREYFADHALSAVEIGGTWLAPGAQRTHVNTTAKLLLLENAFEHWNVRRVDLKSDARNERSRRAIERLGAQFEGILRAWQPSLAPGEEGGVRDTAMYSVLAAEWPAVKVGLATALR